LNRGVQEAEITDVHRPSDGTTSDPQGLLGREGRAMSERLEEAVRLSRFTAELEENLDPDVRPR
jgi:hypothetical protein